MGWIRIERVTWAERVVWVALVAAAIAPVALKPSVDEVARAYVDAINREDIDAAMAVTGTELVMRPLLGGEYRGAREARQVLEYRAALNERWRVLSWMDTGKEVHAGVQVRNDAWTLVGINPRIEVILVVRNGRLLFELARADDTPIRSALQPFLQWAAEKRSRELGSVLRERGRFLWHPDAARQLLALLGEWRTAEAGVAEQPSQEQG